MATVFLKNGGRNPAAGPPKMQVPTNGGFQAASVNGTRPGTKGVSGARNPALGFLTWWAVKTALPKVPGLSDVPCLTDWADRYRQRGSGESLHEDSSSAWCLWSSTRAIRDRPRKRPKP